ncbi:DUF1573 domain-containing protein [Porphyromonadaceae bacterium]
MNRFLYSISIAFISVFISHAQQITFTETVHDFGTFPESAKEVAHEFIFTNTGTSPLIINRVTASCGCTTPTWTREPIPAGGRGYIKVIYNAVGRPGAFDKSITVISNSRKGAVTLKIKGSVTAKRSEPTVAYPVIMGDLKLKSTLIEMKNVGKSEEKTLWIEVMNGGTSPITVGFENVPEYLYVQSNPKTLAPNQLGMIFVTFAAKRIDDWGPRTDEFFLRLNNELPVKDNRTITVTTNIIERFDRSAAVLANAPKIVFSSPVVSMGRIPANQKKSEIVKIQNSGKSDLMIRKLIPSADGISATVERKTLKQGQSTNLRITIDKRIYTKSDVKESIQVISNDPQASISIINISGQ